LVFAFEFIAGWQAMANIKDVTPKSGAKYAELALRITDSSILDGVRSRRNR